MAAIWTFVRRGWAFVLHPLCQRFATHGPCDLPAARPPLGAVRDGSAGSQDRTSDGHLDSADSLRRAAVRHRVPAARAELNLSRAYVRAAFAKGWARPTRKTMFVHVFMVAT